MLTSSAVLPGTIDCMKILGSLPSPCYTNSKITHAHEHITSIIIYNQPCPGKSHHPFHMR